MAHAGRRPALQAVPALFRGWRCAISLRVAHGAGFALPRDAGRRPAFSMRDLAARRAAPSRPRAFSRLAMRDLAARRAAALVSRSRAMPVGDRRSSPRAFSRLAMRDLAARRAAVRGFRAPARCRSETGAPVPALFRGWRCAISLRVAQRCRVSRSRAMPVGDRRSSPRAFSRLAMRDPRASRTVPGFRPARCRSETGAPLFRGWRCAISLRVAQRCRVSRSRAMPVGDRRSFAVSDAPSGQLDPPPPEASSRKP